MLLVGLVVLAVLIATGVFEAGPTRRGKQPSAPHGRVYELPQGSPRVPRLSLGRALGQKIVARYAGVRPTPSLLRAVRAGRVGAVILFSDNLATRALARAAIYRLQRSARAGGNPPLLVMTDQEGGSVRRAAWAPPTLSARQVGLSRDAATVARAQGEATARALRAVGINVDLAPVADVAASPLSFLGDRAFGTDATRVADAACAFSEGLMRGGVAPAFKHFPGLGRASANTDVGPVALSVTRAQLARDLLPYRQCARKLPLVMVSSAVYPALGAEPAVIERSTYAGQLSGVGFRGVTISDDLDSPAISRLVAPSLRGIRAGLDLLLYARGEKSAARSYHRLLPELRARRLDADAVRSSAEQILALKRRWAYPAPLGPPPFPRAHGATPR
jgi:beta-N-acetylhexosaminidase